MRKIKIIIGIIVLTLASCQSNQEARQELDFNFNWEFVLSDDTKENVEDYDSASWRKLNLPHDYSIEGEFSKDNPAKPEGGALPTPAAFYRKSFTIDKEYQDKRISVYFGGVYRNAEVWINGQYLGIRPNGYISFEYDLTDYLKPEGENLIVVKVDNSDQPNSRWYSGSGIYRDVKLIVTNPLHIKPWESKITTKVTDQKAEVSAQIQIKNETTVSKSFELRTYITDASGKLISEISNQREVPAKGSIASIQNLEVLHPTLWDTDQPYLYQITSKLYENNQLIDKYSFPLGLRYFEFDAQKGFSLNGKPKKILGVCLHHDNGALGAVVYKDALVRKLTLMKEMGVNAIRTAHNPPSDLFLDLCDQMGFIVQDEAFDVWKKKKAKRDYHQYWDQWYVRDLQDMVRRDRNHPSIFMWSIGNEIREQFDETGLSITKELVELVKELDDSRPVTSALTENIPEKNYIYQSGALDLLGFNYKHQDYEDFPNRFPGQKIIASESVSALETRGKYVFQDTIQYWPPAYNKEFDGFDDFTVTAYDRTAAYWGSTHEDTWKTVKKLEFISGLFIWTGFDYLGEPIPYPYPARSSYFGIVDLAGLPKDVYYMYQSQWNDNKDVLHLFPHWNWSPGQLIDVWGYYNHADEVELFVNGKSQGIRSLQGEDLHVSWQVPFEAGSLKAVSRKNGQVVVEKEILTAANAVAIDLKTSKDQIENNHYDLVYVEVSLLDDKGTFVLTADQTIEFNVSGGGELVGVDNGYQAGLDSFKSNSCQLFNGKCVAIIKSNGENKNIQFTAKSVELKLSKTIQLQVK